MNTVKNTVKFTWLPQATFAAYITLLVYILAGERLQNC